MEKLIGKIKDKLNTLKYKIRAFLGACLKKLIEKFYKYLPINKRKIVFDNFGGRGYGEHPKYIAEEIHSRNLPWKIIWLVKDENEPMPSWIHKVRFGSWRSLYHVATAKMWVDNIRNAHLLPKKKGQVYMQTWHGAVGFKLVEGEDEGSLNPAYVKKAKYDGSITDAIVSSCKIQTKNYKENFWLNEKTQILEYGGPREDCLFDSQYVKKKKIEMREKLRIGLNEFVILYAPTFRDDGSTSAYHLDFQGIADVFCEKVGRPAKVLVKLHPNVRAKNIFQFSEVLIDGTNIQDPNDAIICSDAVITDFSSIFYEAALLGINCFRYAEDYEDFIKHRNLHPIEKEVPLFLSKSSQEFAAQIKSVDLEKYGEKMQCFLKTVQSFDDGKASKRTVDWLESIIK